MFFPQDEGLEDTAGSPFVKRRLLQQKLEL